MQPKSYGAGVRTSEREKHALNALRFPTAEEADLYARDLSMRWLAVYDWKVVELEEEPNTMICKVEHQRGGALYQLTIGEAHAFQTRGSGHPLTYTPFLGEDGRQLARVSGVCAYTGDPYEVVCSLRGLLLHTRHHVHVQTALEDLPADEREFILSGYSPEGWRQQFPPPKQRR